MFKYPGTEVYNPQGGYRVVWSVEEYEQLLSEGWLAEKPEPIVALKSSRKRGEAVIPISPEPDAA